MEENKVFYCKVMGNEMIAQNVYRMTIESLEVALSAKPGQFVNVYLKGKDTLLPRPVSVCWTDGALVTLVFGVVGKGTQELSLYEKGDWISISAPLGNGYDLSVLDDGGEQPKKALLVGGGIGVPPLLELAYELTEKGIRVVAVLGFKDEPFLVKAMMKTGADVYLATDSGAAGFQGTVVDLIRQEGLTADAYFACGPRPMLKALSAHCQSIGADVQVSMEERMGCGFGACVGCAIPVREKGAIMRKKVCKDGPVFWGSEVIWDAQ